MDVKTLCLGALFGGDASGYEMKKRFEEGPFSHFYAAGFGSIYPALTALCAEGFASCREQPQDKRPDKKVYSITAKGRGALLEALLRNPGRDRVRSDFTFLVFFGEMLPAGHLARVLDGRLAWLRERVAELRRCSEADLSPGASFALGLGIAIYQAQIDYVEANGHVLTAAALQAEAPAAGMVPAVDPADGRV